MFRSSRKELFFRTKGPMFLLTKYVMALLRDIDSRWIFLSVSVLTRKNSYLESFGAARAMKARFLMAES